MSAPGRVLVIDHETRTRTAMRLALESEGFVVLEAQDAPSALDAMRSGQPELVLQNLDLPDIDGFELIKQLRECSNGDVPILAVSAMTDRMGRALGTFDAFDDHLFKPIAPAVLVETVRARLASRQSPVSPRMQGRRVLLVDDDASQRKLLSLRLQHLGCDVEPAYDGQDALARARASAPDIIISDVLMPRMDGFDLCRAVRRDPSLRLVPVVLTSAAYVESADRELAVKCGASALVVRTPDGAETIAAAYASLAAAPLRTVTTSVEKLTEEHRQRIMRQLERQVALNAALQERIASLETDLAVMGAAAETLAPGSTLDAVVEQMLSRLLDATGLPQGAAYLLEADSLVLKAQIGNATTTVAHLNDFFGRVDLLRSVMESGDPLAVSPKGSDGASSADWLEPLGSGSALLCPMMAGRQALGVLVMASPRHHLGEAWLPFGRAAGAQVGQAIMLARMQAELQDNEARFRSIIESTSDVIVVMGADGCITFVSPSVERVLGYRPVELVDTSAVALLHPDDAAAAMQSFASATTTAKVLTDEFRLRHTDGSWRHIEASSRAVDLHGPDLKLISTLRDLSERKEAEAAALEAAIKTERTLRVTEERFRNELEAFSYSVSHDLRAPLRAIDGFSRILLEDHATQFAPETHKYLERVHHSSRYMGRLIDDLLNFSRLSSQGISREQVLPAKLVGEALDDLAFDRGDRNVEVIVGELAPCRGDAALLTQLFVNLLSNAFKFTRKRPVAHIEIGCSQIDGEVVYFVKDDGAGFDMQYAHKLFGVFQRLHRAEDFDGTGVGLAIVQRIVQRHGGRVWAESAVDHGATFSFTLANARMDGQERSPQAAA